MVQLSGQPATNYAITNVASDKDFPTITLPDYHLPLKYAYVDIIIQYIRNNLVGTNKITGGSWGLLDSGATYRKSGDFQDGNVSIDSGITRYQQLQFNGYVNISAYLSPGMVVTPRLSQLTATGDNIQFKDMIAIIRLYFEA